MIFLGFSGSSTQIEGRQNTVSTGVMITPQVLNTCGVWGARAKVQVSMRELYTHIHLD